MRTEYLYGNRTTWTYTDTRIKPLTFYEQDLQHRIAIHELGGEEGFNDFANHLANVEELKREKGMKESIMELKSFIQIHRINSNSANKIGTAGSLISRQNNKTVYIRKRKRNRKQI